MPRGSKAVVESFLDVSGQLGLTPACILHCSDDHIPGLFNESDIKAGFLVAWIRSMIQMEENCSSCG